MDGKELVFSIIDDGEKTDVKVAGLASELVMMIGSILYENKDLKMVIELSLEAIKSGAFDEESIVRVNGDA
jgi:hypothetical protein